MKKWITIIFLSFMCLNLQAEEISSSSSAETASCDPLAVSPELALDSLSEDVGEIKCDEVNRKNSCANERSVNPETRAQFIASMSALDTAYKSANGNLELTRKTHDLSSDIDSKYPGTTMALRKTGKLIEKNRGNILDLNYKNYRDIPQGSTAPIRSEYHQFLKTSGNDSKFSKYQENFVDDYLEFEQEFECQKGVDVSAGHSITSPPKTVAAEAGMGECEQDERTFRRKYEASKSIFENYFNERYGAEKGVERGISCSDKIQIRSFTTVAYERKSCAGRFEQLFDDNEWDMNLSSLSSDPEYAKFKECIEKMQADGFVLSNVSIASSASQLNNTNQAQQKYCKKGFLELSKARANSARNLLASEFSFPNESMSINPNGANRNGSSGDCPYEIKNGQEVLKSEFAHGKPGRKKLDEAKYVKVSVNFEPKVVPVQREKSCYQAYVSCSRMEYKCGEWSRADTGWGLRQARKRAASDDSE